MSATTGFALRDAASDDLPEIARIYGHHVLTGLASFEDEAPGEAEMRRRHQDVLARGLPWLVACYGEGAVKGYAYAAPYRQRSSYRYTLEDSIYVAPDAIRRGIGRALLTALIERCTALGYRQLVAVIGDSANVPSIALHGRLGFGRVGVLPATGWKFGRWVDSVLMQRALGDGDTTDPTLSAPSGRRGPG
ncbi:MAG TPA: GNAT family N-acetyltransferase [Stellaceae bacterium]|nr:GNAT family N-acetyltransferase [Stellaceae bacterium]